MGFKSKKNKGQEAEGAAIMRDADLSLLDDERADLDDDILENGANETDELSSDDGDSDDSSEGELEPVEAPTMEMLLALEAERDAAKNEAADSRDKYIRALADFENYKKRALKERSDLLKYQGERAFVDMLGIVDNLELALEHSDAEPEKFKDGIKMIHKMLVDVLARWEVRAESGVGKEFDPNKYAAISKVALDDTPPGTITAELKKAYFYKDKLIRVGEVVVATEPERSEPVAGDDQAEDSGEAE